MARTVFAYDTFHELSCDTGLKLEDGIHNYCVLTMKLSDTCRSSRILDKREHHRIWPFAKLIAARGCSWLLLSSPVAPLLSSVEAHMEAQQRT